MIDERNSLSRLPRGWIWTTLKEISEVLKAGGTPLTTVKQYYENGTIPFVKIEDIVGSNKYLYETKTMITEEGLKNSAAWLVPKDSILYSMYASYGEPIINKIEVATSQAIICYISPDDMIALDFIYYFLKKIKPELRTRGTTQKNLNAQIVSNLPVPLAPLPEQRRIVTKIDELFTLLDAGLESLGKVKAQLKRYRQAVLKYASEGKLTEEWRKTHRNKVEPAQTLLERIEERKKKAKEKYSKHVPKDAPSLGLLPEEWVLASVELLSESIVDCLHSTPSFTDTGKYCIDTNCIEPNRILFEKARFVSEETYRERVRRLEPRAGDILFAREGTIGTAVVVPENVELCLGQRMMMFRPEREVIPSFFMWSLLSPFFEKQWKTKVAGSTVPHINIRDIKSMLLPLPSVQEQKVICDEVERSYSVAMDLSKTLEKCLRYAELMRGSILRTAFRGKLVPQDPADEPAEKLLERIKEERAKRMSKEGTSKIRMGKETPKEVGLMRYVK